MTDPLIDRAALARQRRRANGDFAPFLHDQAIDEIKDRLSLVNKSFTSPAVISAVPDLWQRPFPDAQLLPDDEVLDLEPESRDLIIDALTLHWSNDPLGQMIQARRALRPDGLYMAVMFGGGTLNELRSALAQAEADILGGLSPRIAPMAEIRDLGGLLQRAGFVLPVADSLPLSASYASPLDLMRDLRAMGETNALSARPRTSLRRSVLQRACEVYQAHFADSTDRVRATFDMVFLIGWSPGPDQPQPLRPGSAQARLADVLGTKESSLKD